MRIKDDAIPSNLDSATANAGSNAQPKPSLRFLVASLAGGNIISMTVNMVNGILMGRLVAPATLGLFSGISLILGYAPLLQLGILSGLNRELPYFHGKGDLQRVRELAAAGQAFAIAMGGTISFVLLCISGWHLFRAEMREAAGWLTNAVLVLFVFYNAHYLQLTFKSSHDFSRLAMVGVIESLVGLALLSLVALLNFYGMCLRAVLVGSVGTAILFYFRPIHVAPHWDFKHLKHLFAIGAPIFGGGLLYSYWNVINATFVLKFAGTEGMGLYAMVLMAGSVSDILPSAVGAVVYPKMSEQYGRGGGVFDLLRIARTPILASVAGMIPVIAIGWLLAGPVVRLLVPAYAAAVPAMQWALLISFVTCLMPINSIFIVLRRQYRYFAAIAVGMLSNWLILLWLIHDDVQLKAFPQAMLAGRIVFIIICYSLMMHLARRSDDDRATQGNTT